MRLKEGNKEKDILDAAVIVFAEEGFHKARISKIAEVAGVATGSVYVYFKNKEDLLHKIFEKLWGRLYTELQKISVTNTLSPYEKIDTMIDFVIDTFTENPPLALVFVNEQIHLTRGNENRVIDFYEKILDLGENVLKEGVEKGIFSGDFDVKYFRYFFFGALRNLLHQWAHDPKKFPLNQIRQNVKYLTKHGIIK